MIYEADPSWAGKLVRDYHTFEGKTLLMKGTPPKYMLDGNINLSLSGSLLFVMEEN